MLADVAAVAENPKPVVDIAVLGEKGKAQLQRDLSKSLVLSAVDYSRVGINFSLVSCLGNPPCNIELLIADRFGNKRFF